MLVFPSGGFSYHEAGHEFTSANSTCISGAALLLLLLLILEIADRVVMKRDLQIAREIQTWLLPGAPPQIPGTRDRLRHAPREHRGRRLLRRFSASREDQRRQPRGARRRRCRRQRAFPPPC